MNLLGNYETRLYDWHRQELLAQLSEALRVGEWGGGKLIDSTVADRIRSEAQDFSSLPAILAGSLATADSLNYPLSVLLARYKAISQERLDFLKRMDLFLAVLEKDSNLVDQLIAAAAMETWVSRRGALGGALKFYQDFSATHGACATSLPLTDPATGVVYPSAVRDSTYVLNSIAGLEQEPIRSGISVPVTGRTFSFAGLSWTYTAADSTESQELTSSDWAKLSLLEAQPRVQFGAPTLQVLSPPGGSVRDTIRVWGQNLSGNLPVWVRLFLTPRRVVQTVETGAAGDEVAISAYRLSGDDVIVLDGTRSYDQGIDYAISTSGRLTPSDAAANKTLTVHCTVMFPAYQASVNQEDWSEAVLFDAAAPYLSNILHSLDVQDGRFPLFDESGSPFGLSIELRSVFESDYLLRIDTPALPGAGVGATLNLALTQPYYVDSLHLAPFATFPVRIQSITADGVPGAARVTLFEGSLLADRPLSVRFPRTLVSTFHVQLEQVNYEYKNHTFDPADRLRREALTGLQASLPFSSRRIRISVPREVSGIQYEFGLHEIYAEDLKSEMPSGYGVFIAGPFEVPGTPELLRLDADYTGNTDFYLIDTPFQSDAVQTGSAFHDTNPHGIPVTPGVAFSYTPPPSLPALAKCQFYVKFVLRSEYAVVERFLFQATAL